jgi:hypothetical protein
MKVLLPTVAMDLAKEAKWFGSGKSRDYSCPAGKP